MQVTKVYSDSGLILCDVTAVSDGVTPAVKLFGVLRTCAEGRRVALAILSEIEIAEHAAVSGQRTGV